MTKVYLVRHGPTHAKTMVGWSDLPADLSDTAQLARLSAYLPDDAVVISSDLIRASATADAIAGNRLRLPHARGLRELHFGAWELQAFDRVDDPDRLRAFWDQPGDARAPGGESWNDLRARVDATLTDVIGQHPKRPVIAVAHMGAILTQVQRALRVSAYDAFSHKISNLSVTEVQYRTGAWHAEKINHHP